MTVLLERLTSQISEKHSQALLTRELDARWIEANCRSLSAEQATQRLGYTAKSGGILLEGEGIQVQFKPDRPWKREGDKKAAKYRSPLGDYDAMLPLHPVDTTYWTDLEALKAKCYQVDGHPCLVITEGFFKALAGCSSGIATIALLGVEMGLSSSKADTQGKRYLVPELERLARAGFGFVIAYDADCATNANVILAQRKLAEQLLKFNIPVYSITGNWTIEEGKGMDDFIQKNGGDRFKREVLGKAFTHSEWLNKIQKLEAQFNDGDKKKVKIPPADVIGLKMTEEYRDRFLWSDEHKSWMEYSLDRNGVWSPVSDLYVESAIDKVLESRGIIGYGSSRYISNIAAKMKRGLFTREWGGESLKLLPFSDGVYDLSTGGFNPHSPGFRLTWCLPRRYTVLETDWSKINGWLDEATGKKPRNKEVLLCFAAAVLRGRADLQKFLHLIGVGGTGKSTFTRLLEVLIGSENCFIGSLQELADKHVVVELLSKRLAIFPDQDKLVGSLSNFKRLTGQDALNGRRLYKDGINFRFPGMAVVTSNGPIFHAGGGSWLTRRILMSSFDHKPVEIRDLEKEFEPELSAFTSYLLSIPNEDITRVLRGLGKGDVQKPLWQAQIRTDSIAAWVNEWVIYAPTERTPIGCDRNEWLDGTYDAKISTLFGSYSHFCRITGHQPKSKNNFSSDLLELTQQTLGWVTSYCRGSTGQRMIQGLRLKTNGDTDPTLEDSLTTDNLSDHPSDNLTDDLKPLMNNNSDNPDNLTEPKFLPTNQSTTAIAQNELAERVIESANTEKDLPEEVVGLPESSTVETLQVVSDVVSEVVSEVVREPDFSTFPHRSSDNIQAKRNFATKIRELLLAAQDESVIADIKGTHGENQVLWVRQYILSNAERAKVEAIAQTEQLNLLSSSTDPWMSEENLEDIAKSLRTCPDKEMLAVLRRCWPGYAMNAACKLLTPEKHEQIRQWVTELNACANRQ